MLTPPPAVDTWRALGTGIHLAVAHGPALTSARRVVEETLDAIDCSCSRFRPDSELERVNARAGDWVAVSPLLGRALEVALDAAAVTGGLVDPTVGEAVRAAGYSVTFGDLPPVGPALRLLVRPAPGWRAVELDVPGGRVRLPRGARLDLGATAKALASDLAAEAAHRAIGGGVLVSCGGDIAVAGEPPEGGWIVRVTEFSGASVDAPGQTVAVFQGGLATSGTTARRWIRGGVELHHIIDPSTGLPAPPHWQTVTVAGATCVDANLAATAAVVLGPGAVAWLAERRMPARLVRRQDGCVLRVPPWPAEALAA